MYLTLLLGHLIKHHLVQEFIEDLKALLVVGIRRKYRSLQLLTELIHSLKCSALKVQMPSDLLRLNNDLVQLLKVNLLASLGMELLRL
jgi:hypothetical protein